MPKHIRRLILIFIIFIALFLVAKHFLTPASFGTAGGHFRGDAIGEVAGLEAKYTGSEACVDCHEDIDTLKQSGVHKGINCETCHGPGYLHIEDEANEMSKGDSREFCVRCHAKVAGRPGIIVQIDPEEHNVEENCIECHNPHEPWN